MADRPAAGPRAARRTRPSREGTPVEESAVSNDVTTWFGTGTEQADAATAGTALLQRVEEHLRSFLAAERRTWAAVDERAVVPVDALSQLIASGGKRIRPAFCITGYLA